VAAFKCAILPALALLSRCEVAEGACKQENDVNIYRDNRRQSNQDKIPVLLLTEMQDSPTETLIFSFNE
jgi:hypothetical protein